ncbi:sterol o-acyltransferase [Anaeramoeba ignava]|uniref:O-acyltransferase n=1 Tax=Anaeramoeba ignava TaxID=1746090 RepID=A0A9Q0REJ9_ANAIG|nr:sterol o-acyltransferase [Anaeramoeba ignava]
MESKTTNNKSKQKTTRRHTHSPQNRNSLIENEPGPKTLSVGLENLAIVIVILLFAEKIVSNFEKGEPFVDWSLFLYLTGNLHIVLVISFLMICWCSNILLLEILIVKKYISNTIAYILYSISQFILFIVPTYLALKFDFSIMGRGAITMQMAVLLMKTHSFFFKETKGKKYPSNINLKDFGLYLVYPTLVYELEFPRTEKRDWMKILKYSFLMSGSLFVAYLNINYFMVPGFKETWEKNFGRLVLKLAVPTVFAWLTMFYGVFHCFLNLIAEIFMFADRKFYDDWWNALSFDQFWNKWNSLVYEWFLRHIYIDSMVDMKVPKAGATVLVFLVSALWHEYIISMSFLLIRPYMFASMLGQFSVIYVTRIPSIRNSRFGNLIMWFGLSAGQAVVYLGYSMSYFAKITAQNSNQIPKSEL